MKVKDYLSQLKLINIKLNNKIVEKEELFTMGTKITPSYSGMPSGTNGVNDKTANVAVLLVQIDTEINAMISEMVLLKRAIISDIEKLSDSRYYQVLYKRYVEYKDFSVIAYELHYTYQTTLNLHNKALKTLQRIIKK